VSNIKDFTKEDILNNALLTSRPDEEPYYYMYSIVRDDIEMDEGKRISQSGHAFTDSLASAKESHPEAHEGYRTWAANNSRNGGAKVAMKCRNESQLIIAFNLARKAGLPCSIVVDKGHIMLPDFDGNPIITALGIGPCSKEDAKHITKRFQCIQTIKGAEKNNILNIISSNSNMSIGKIVAQRYHAYSGLDFSLIQNEPELYEKLKKTKITQELKFSSKQDLSDLIQYITNNDLNHHFVAASTELDALENNGPLTAIAIGPCTSEEAQYIKTTFNLIF